MKTVTVGYHFLKICFFLCAMFLTATFIGCATQKVWTKKGLTQEQFDRDFARCEREAASSTQIVNYANSTELEQGLDRSITKDKLINKCMFSKGYKLENK